MTPVATIVVVNYRTPELARACVDSAMRFVDVTSELGVVDTSDGPGAVTNLPPGIVCEYHENIGYAAALNRGFAGAQAPVLIACNADVEFPADGILPLLALFDEHPSLGVIGPRQVSPDGRLVHGGIAIAGETSGGRCYGEPNRGQCAERLLEVEQVSGSVMLIRREALLAIGGELPEPPLYFEDSLLCLRMRCAGWKVGFSGLRTFIHHVAASPDPPGGRARLAETSRAMFEAEVAR